jgi:hypothetical protein
MKKMKLELSDGLKIHLSNMREILAGISIDEDFISSPLPSQRCGEQCEVTCAHYCHSNCSDTCKGECSDFFAAGCTLRVIFVPEE